MSFFDAHRSHLKPFLFGLLSAVLFVSFLTGILPAFLLTFAAPFPLFMIGLREGTRPLTVSLLTGSLTSLVFADLEATVLYLSLVAVPVFLFVVTGVRGLSSWPLEEAGNGASSQGEAARVTSFVIVHQLYGLLLLTGLFVLFLKVIDGAAVKELLKVFLAAYKLPVDEKALILFYSVLPGLCAAGGMVTLFLNGLGAQQILKGQGKALLPTPKLEALSLPFWPWIALAVAGIVAFSFPESLLGVYGRNVLLVLRVLFLLQGLSVAHAYAKTKPYGKGFLVSLYIFTFVIDWLGLLIAGLGVLEPWIKVRQRLANRQ